MPSPVMSSPSLSPFAPLGQVIKTAYNEFAEIIIEKAKCAQPDLTEIDAMRAFVPSLGQQPASIHHQHPFSVSSPRTLPCSHSRRRGVRHDPQHFRGQLCKQGVRRRSGVPAQFLCVTPDHLDASPSLTCLLDVLEWPRRSRLDGAHAAARTVSTLTPQARRALSRDPNDMVKLGGTLPATCSAAGCVLCLCRTCMWCLRGLRACCGRCDAPPPIGLGALPVAVVTRQVPRR